MATDLSWPADRMSKFIDVTPRRLSQLVEEGVVTRVERGRYNPFHVTVAYIRWLRDQRSAPPDAAAETATAEAKVNRARITAAEADSAEMTAAKKRGELMFTKDAELRWADVLVEQRKLIQTKEQWDSGKLLTALSKIKLSEP